MPLRVRRHPLAVEDLDEIWLTIASDNQRAADRLVEQVYAAETLIAEFPEIGEARPEFGGGVRKWTVGNHVLFYRVEVDAIIVIRILHGARDFPALFGRG